MMKGRAVCGNIAKGEAIVFQAPFSFIGDMDPKSGEVTMANHPLFGTNLKGKVLIVTTGHGGTIAPFMAYEAQRNGCGPAAIACNYADNITVECAIVMGIPLVDGFQEDITKSINNGQMVIVDGNNGTIDVIS